MLDEEGRLRDAISTEFEWGTRFLAKEGHAGATLIVSPADQFGAYMWELGGRFAARPDRRSHAVIELDPGRRGWRIEGSLSICPDDEDSCSTVDLGSARLLEFEETLSECRVMVRRAVLALRDHLSDQSDRSEIG
jgi:hypothetical protein